MRHASKFAFCILLFCITTHAAFAVGKTGESAETLESVMTTQVEGSIVIDPDGRVADYRVDSAVADNLRVVLDKTVRQWRFQPVVIDGTPRVARVQMRLTLTARAAGGANYQVKVDNVLFPAEPTDEAGKLLNPTPPATITAQSMKPPGYPMGLQKLGVEGVVLLALNVDTDGKVAHVQAVQSSLLDVKASDRMLAAAMKQLEDSALVAARKWRFKVVANSAALTPKDLTVMVPVVYIISRKPRSPGLWRIEVRTPQRKMAWLDASSGIQKVGVSDLAPDEILPVASAIKLETLVIGTVVM